MFYVIVDELFAVREIGVTNTPFYPIFLEQELGFRTLLFEAYSPYMGSILG
jgi:hypothetical protein